MPWFVKIERGCVSKSEFDRHVPAHKAYVRKLNESGHSARTGYWAEMGGGMLLFQADSLEEARRIIARDPLVISGCVEYELHEWVVVVE
ncbi:MAG: YciI family protein [Cyanobacteria bacterium J06642_2]